MKKGIDVSKWQGEINWEQVKASGVEFAIIRLGEIYQNDTNYVDTYFERNYSECKRLGIPVGIYVYTYCKTEDKIKEGANFVLSHLQGKTLDLPVYLDLEEKRILEIGKDQITNLACQFGNIIEKAGLWCGIYANLNWIRNYLNMNILNRFTLWIAQYNIKCTYEGSYDIWQYSSSGQVTGIKGNVDMNYMYRDLISEIGKYKKPVENVNNYVDYIIGKTYKLQDDMNVRTGAGTNYRVKNYLQLTKDGKKHAYKQLKAVLKKGTEVTVLGIYKVGNEIWIKIPSGYIAGYYNGQTFVK